MNSIGRDLLSFGTPILVLGDPAQLPPVKGAGFFTDAHPDVLLTQIHRQALDSPIIRLSKTIREGGRPELGSYGDALFVARRSDIGLIEVDQALCGRNATRKQVNDLARSSTGWTDPMPVKGDRLVCLRNNKRKGTFNGTLGSVARVLGLDGSFILLDFESDEGASSKVSVHRAFFEGTDHRMSPEKRAKLFDQFVYGYALTVHKAQGSQWDHVLVLDESACFREDSARWLYTAVTRAAKRLTLAMQ